MTLFLEVRAARLGSVELSTAERVKSLCYFLNCFCTNSILEISRASQDYVTLAVHDMSHRLGEI